MGVPTDGDGSKSPSARDANGSRSLVGPRKRNSHREVGHSHTMPNSMALAGRKSEPRISVEQLESKPEAEKVFSKEWLTRWTSKLQSYLGKSEARDKTGRIAQYGGRSFVCHILLMNSQNGKFKTSNFASNSIFFSNNLF